MGSVCALSAKDHGLEPRLGQTRDYTIGIYCFSAKHMTLNSKNKARLAQNLFTVSEWSDMSIRGLLFEVAL